MNLSFSRPEAFLSGLEPDSVSAIIASATDLALLVGDDDIIKDLACTLAQVDESDFTPWRGSLIEDVVAAEGSAGLRKMMASVREGDTAAPCNVTHILKNGEALEIRYSACAIGAQDEIILMGREFTSLTSLRNRMATLLQRMEHATDAPQADTGQPSLSAQIFQRSSEKVQSGARTAGYLRSQVGTVPLKEMVRDTTDLIEKDCISTALQLTGNNRALAARVLGLSRQSLYIKMRRYGLTDDTQPSDVE